MNHPLEPLGRLLRLGVVTDTAVPVPGRPPNTIEAVRNTGWLQAAFAGGGALPEKDVLSQFISPRVFCAERFLHPVEPPPSPPARKIAIRDHARAAVYTLVSTLVTAPFTMVYVAAATKMARYPMQPASGNLAAMRFLVGAGGVRALWQGVAPLALGHLLDESTYRLRLKALPSAAVYALVSTAQPGNALAVPPPFSRSAQWMVAHVMHSGRDAGLHL